MKVSSKLQKKKKWKKKSKWEKWKIFASKNIQKWSRYYGKHWNIFLDDWNFPMKTIKKWPKHAKINL